MMYVWGHSFEFERNNNWEIIEEFCEMIANRDDIWYATNSDIVEYNELFDRLEFFADNEYVHNPSVKSVWLAVNNSTIVNYNNALLKATYHYRFAALFLFMLKILKCIS